MVTMSMKGDSFPGDWRNAECSPHPEAAYWRMVTRPRPWSPPTDVYETEGAINVRVEIAGMKDADFSVTIQDRTLVIRGQRQEEVAERRAYCRMEIPFGEFRTEIELPVPVVEQEIQASYQDGFLQILLPKEAPHRIHVEDQEE